ncbi:hypothetical protein LCGC14_3011070, partial [marine sediment metagenome]
MWERDLRVYGTTLYRIERIARARVPSRLAEGAQESQIR